jgi:hypothetical protein
VQGVATHVQEAKSLEELVRTDITASLMWGARPVFFFEGGGGGGGGGAPTPAAAPLGGGSHTGGCAGSHVAAGTRVMDGGRARGHRSAVDTLCVGDGLLGEDRG